MKVKELHEKRIIALSLCAIVLIVAMTLSSVSGVEPAKQEDVRLAEVPGKRMVELSVFEKDEEILQKGGRVREAEVTAVQEAVPPKQEVQTASAKPAATKVYTMGSTGDIPLSEKDLKVLLKACEDYNVDPALVLGIIETESGFNPNAVNKAGTCYSYMQISGKNEGWLKSDLGIDSVKNPEDNIRAGVYIISGYLNKYDDEAMALMCYNHGEGGAKAKFSQGVTETGYTGAVIQRSEKWAEVLENAGYTQGESTAASPSESPAASPSQEQEAQAPEETVVAEETLLLEPEEPTFLFSEDIPEGDADEKTPAPVPEGEIGTAAGTSDAGIEAATADEAVTPESEADN